MNLVQVTDQEQLISVISLADSLFSIITIIFGAAILSRTLLSHHFTNTPRVLVKVSQLNLRDWLADGQHIYPKLFGWGVFLWVATAVVLQDSFAYATSWYITIFMVVFTIYYSFKVFIFLDAHVNDIIRNLYEKDSNT